MIAKTLNIRCFVAKTHLSQFTLFFSDNKCPLFTRFWGGRVPWKRTMSHFLPVFLYLGSPNSFLPKSYTIKDNRVSPQLDMLLHLPQVHRQRCHTRLLTHQIYQSTLKKLLYLLLLPQLRLSLQPHSLSFQRRKTARRGGGKKSAFFDRLTFTAAIDMTLITYIGCKRHSTTL